MIDITKTKFIVFAYPDGRWAQETIWWIESLVANKNMPASYRHSLNKADLVCARNTAVQVAIGSHKKFEHFVFIDADVKPTQDTTEFLELKTDIKCCQVQQRNEKAWMHHDSFHDPLWSTSRKVLESISPPWFWFPYNDTHTEITNCLCSTFRDKALKSGFSISHAGWAVHTSDRSWCR